MRLFLTFFTTIFLLWTPASAKTQAPKVQVKKEHKHETGKKHDHSDTKTTAKKISDDKIVLKVKGMVCAFCAQGIEKNFNEKPEVQSTKVNLDTMEVLVQYNKGKSLPLNTIKEIVTDAGFAFEGVIE